MYIDSVSDSLRIFEVLRVSQQLFSSSKTL
ncbi:MAG: hypothetical protein EZS28_029315, partial [Streblomastix strix]